MCAILSDNFLTSLRVGVHFHWHDVRTIMLMMVIHVRRHAIKYISHTMCRQLYMYVHKLYIHICYKCVHMIEMINWRDSLHSIRLVCHLNHNICVFKPCTICVSYSTEGPMCVYVSSIHTHTHTWIYGGARILHPRDHDRL